MSENSPIYYELEHIQTTPSTQDFMYSKNLPKSVIESYNDFYFKIIRIRLSSQAITNMTIARIALTAILPPVIGINYDNKTSPGKIVADFNPDPSGKVLYEPTETYDIGGALGTNMIQFGLFYQDNLLEWHPLILSQGDYMIIRVAFIKK